MATAIKHHPAVRRHMATVGVKGLVRSERFWRPDSAVWWTRVPMAAYRSRRTLQRVTHAGSYLR